MNNIICCRFKMFTLIRYAIRTDSILFTTFLRNLYERQRLIFIRIVMSSHDVLMERNSLSEQTSPFVLKQGI